MILRQKKALELTADRELLRVIQDAWEQAARIAGDHLICRPGCTACCHGPFPISALDARRLRRGLAELSRSAPERSAAIALRARAQSERFPSGAAIEEICERFGDIPCPVLETETGRCELYEHRPLTCRTFGPPTRFGEESIPPCDLSFEGASEAEIEAARVEPDPDDLEGKILARLPERDRETLIAFALGKG